ncbi:exported hypothetical protein [Verrucomicrobia bacterium]|nr:exported hypothetical protein [Verrucomicrobiota bacterium]
MYILKLIGLTILNLFRGTQAVASAAKEKRRQAGGDVSEVERLDRIRQPWKYRGR